MAREELCPGRYSDCQLKLLRGELMPTTKYNYLARMDPENRGGDSACPLGVAVLAEGRALRGPLGLRRESSAVAAGTEHHAESV